MKFREIKPGEALREGQEVLVRGKIVPWSDRDDYQIEIAYAGGRMKSNSCYAKSSVVAVIEDEKPKLPEKVDEKSVGISGVAHELNKLIDYIDYLRSEAEGK